MLKKISPQQIYKVSVAFSLALAHHIRDLIQKGEVIAGELKP